MTLCRESGRVAAAVDVSVQPVESSSLHVDVGNRSKLKSLSKNGKGLVLRRLLLLFVVLLVEVVVVVEAFDVVESLVREVDVVGAALFDRVPLTMLVIRGPPTPVLLVVVPPPGSVGPVGSFSLNRKNLIVET